MQITVTGATGLIGERLLAVLADRGAQVTVLARDPARARRALGVEAVRWEPASTTAPGEALRGRDAVVHLAGEPVAQRWSAAARERIRASRELGTRNLVAGIERLSEAERPRALISASAVGYYGPRGDEDDFVTESSPAGDDFLARVCVAWEHEAQAAEPLGLRVARIRTGVVLDRGGGALAKMLPFFKLGIGGPVAGGRQIVPWIHADDVVAMYVAAIEREWAGAYNAAAPDPITNRELAKALGRALHRPAVLPVPGLAVALLYGRMAQIVTTGQCVIPERPLEQGFRFRFESIDAALRDALA